MEKFGLSSRTPMKFRLISPCCAAADDNKYHQGELVITRKNLAFFGDDNEQPPVSILRKNILSVRKSDGDFQLEIVHLSKNKEKQRFRLKNMPDTNVARAVKIIGHLIKTEEKKK